MVLWCSAAQKTTYVGRQPVGQCFGSAVCVCVCVCANCQLPRHGGVFSCNQFSPVAFLCLLVQASLHAGLVYVQSSSLCEAVRVKRPMYIFSPGQRRVELCHHFGQPHAPKVHSAPWHPTGDCVCVCVCVCDTHFCSRTSWRSLRYITTLQLCPHCSDVWITRPLQPFLPPCTTARLPPPPPQDTNVEC